jgi:hypothetical protein
MKSSVEKIREEIKINGGLRFFSSAVRKNRHPNRPMKRMMISELAGSNLSQEELNVAWELGLIGNAGSVNGSIVANAKR